MDDDGLIARMAAGDGTALKELFTRHTPWLAARLRAALPASDVQDVLQETFLGRGTALAVIGQRARRKPGCGVSPGAKPRCGSGARVQPHRWSVAGTWPSPVWSSWPARGYLGCANAGVGTFYRYLPDLSMAQVMFLAGLTLGLVAALGLPAGAGDRRLRRAAAALTVGGVVVAGTAVGLAGTGRMDAQGMIAIPALHDAAERRPGALHRCLQPQRRSCLLQPGLRRVPARRGVPSRAFLHQVAGLPGAPVRVDQVAASYVQGPGNRVGTSTRSFMSVAPPVFHLVLPDEQGPAPVMTSGQLALQVAATAAAQHRGKCHRRRRGCNPGRAGGDGGLFAGRGAPATIRASGVATTSHHHAPGGSRPCCCPTVCHPLGRSPSRVVGNPRRHAEGGPGDLGPAAMTTSAASAQWPESASQERGAGLSVLAGARLVHLHWASRRGWFALGAVAACGLALGAAVHWHWDTYGALQLPLLFETAAVAIVAVAMTSPFGEPERATGRWLPFLRLGLAMALSAAGPSPHCWPAPPRVVWPAAHWTCSATRPGLPGSHCSSRPGSVAGWPGCGSRLHGGRMLRPVQGVARAGLDHTVDMAGPPAPRSRCRALRQPCLRRRHARLFIERRPRSRRGIVLRTAHELCRPGAIVARKIPRSSVDLALAVRGHSGG